MPKIRSVTINNIYFKSVSEASKILGISRSTLCSRIASSPEGNISIAPPTNNYEIEGISFPNLKKAAAYFGINYQTFVSRYKSGVTGVKLIGKASRQFECKRVEVNGIVFLSTKNMIEHYGLCQATYHKWIKFGLTPAETIEIMLDKESNKTTKAA